MWERLQPQTLLHRLDTPMRATENFSPLAESRGPDKVM